MTSSNAQDRQTTRGGFQPLPPPPRPNVRPAKLLTDPASGPPDGHRRRHIDTPSGGPNTFVRRHRLTDSVVNTLGAGGSGVSAYQPIHDSASQHQPGGLDPENHFREKNWYQDGVRSDSDEDFNSGI